MSEASAIRQVQYIRNGNTLTPYLQSDMGDLFQEYQGTTDAPEAVEILSIHKMLVISSLPSCRTM